MVIEPVPMWPSILSMASSGRSSDLPAPGRPAGAVEAVGSDDDEAKERQEERGARGGEAEGTDGQSGTVHDKGLERRHEAAAADGADETG